MKRRMIMLERRTAGLLAALIVTVIGIVWTGCGSAASEDAPPGMMLWSEITAKQVPESQELLRRGSIVYGTRCTTCHGSMGDGQGPGSLFLKTPPRDFTKLKFKLTTNEFFPFDLDLFRSITAGFPVYGMPSFRYLPEEDRWALVYFIKKLGRDGWIEDYRETEGKNFDPEEAQAIVFDLMDPGEPIVVGSEPPVEEPSLARGKELYDESCLKCHGESGRGDGPSASEQEDNWGRPIEPRDFSEASVFRKGGWRLVDTVRLTQTGVGGTGMPAHTDFTEAENWDLARYVHQLRDRARRENATQ